MKFNRREFFLLWIRAQEHAQPMTVEVLEIFQRSDGPCALLVHHAQPELRQDFSSWIHRFDGAQVQLRTSDGSSRTGRIFRAKMCFGRGLLLVPSMLNVRIKDEVRIELS